MHPFHKPQIIIDHHGDGRIARLRHAITEACLSALEVSGPILHSHIIGVDVHIHRIVCGRPQQISNGLQCIENVGDLSIDRLSNTQLSSPSLLALLKTTCIASLRDAVSKIPSWRLMEPMMDIELQLPAERGCESELSAFLGDLTNRRAEIKSVDNADLNEDDKAQRVMRYHCIHAVAPLSELANYSKTVRCLSSGRAELNLRLTNYHPVSREHQEKLLNQYKWSGTTILS
ncbi:unnamed protein product [Heterobilharzia americana]|nr:unnamed protein product [Heterobilharzia americana]